VFPTVLATVEPGSLDIVTHCFGDESFAHVRGLARFGLRRVNHHVDGVRIDNCTWEPFIEMRAISGTLRPNKNGSVRAGLRRPQDGGGRSGDLSPVAPQIHSRE
jgi:hypothetical protein